MVVGNDLSLIKRSRNNKDEPENDNKQQQQQITMSAEAKRNEKKSYCSLASTVAFA